MGAPNWWRRRDGEALSGGRRTKAAQFSAGLVVQCRSALALMGRECCLYLPETVQSALPTCGLKPRV